MSHILPSVIRPLMLVACALNTLAAAAQEQRATTPQPVPAVVLAHLRQHQEPLTTTDLQDLQLTSETRTADSGLRLLYLQQRYRGVPIHGAVSTVALRGADQVVNVADRFVPGSAKKAAAWASAPSKGRPTAASTR